MAVQSPRSSRDSSSSFADDVPMIENPQHGSNGHSNGNDPEAATSAFNKPQPHTRVLSLHPSFYILSWIFFSNCTILFNKWLIDNAGFRYRMLAAVRDGRCGKGCVLIMM